MERSQPTERAIYVPRGRRELIASTNSAQANTSKPLDQQRDLLSKKRPVQEEENLSSASPARNNKPARSESTSEVTQVMMESRPKPAPREIGIYVPKGRRELSEKQTTEAPPKAAEPVVLPKEFVAPRKSEAVGNVAQISVNSIPTSISADQTAVADSSPSPTEEVLTVSKLELNGTAPSKPKEAVRGIYIPKGRRELNEKKALEVPAVPVMKTTKSEEVNKKSDSSSNSGRQYEEDGECDHAPVSSKSKLTAYTNWDDASNSEEEPEFVPFARAEQVTPPPAPSLEETVAASSLLLTGVPAEMSDMAKGNIVRTYLDKGASVKWVSVGECVIVFKTEKAAVSALPGTGMSIFRVVRVRDIAQPRRDELVAAAKEFFTVTKPERDNTVANRLIGAALGIRITSTKPVNTDIASRKPRAPSPPREDAWDD